MEQEKPDYDPQGTEKQPEEIEPVKTEPPLQNFASGNLPAKVKAIASVCRDGKFTAAAKMHHSLFGLTKSLFLDGNPVGIKYGMKVAGLDSGDLRLPLCEANQSTQKAIEHFMKESGAPFSA